MKTVNNIVILALMGLTLVESAFAQNVPSAVSILPTQTKPTTSNGEDEETSRYERRAVPRRKVMEVERKPESPQQKVVEPNPEMLRPLDQASSMSTVAPSMNKEERDAPAEPKVDEQMRDLLIGGSPDQLDRYTSFLAPDDIRRNRVELVLAPQFIYNDSQSDYYYRNYITNTPGGRVGLSVWFTPFFGLEADYEKTFLGTMRKTPTSSSQTPYMDSTTQMGFRFRRFSSHSLTSPSLTLSVDYLDYQKRVPLDDQTRNKLQTSGVLIGAESRMPSSESAAWILGIDYMPIANHKEYQTAANVNSGTGVETLRLGTHMGVELKLDRTNRLFFKVREIYEKNAFTGDANAPDPINGQRPENVAVTNNFLIFEIGYIWGH